MFGNSKVNTSFLILITFLKLDSENQKIRENKIWHNWLWVKSYKNVIFIDLISVTQFKAWPLRNNQLKQQAKKKTSHAVAIIQSWLWLYFHLTLESNPHLPILSRMQSSFTFSLISREILNRLIYTIKNLFFSQT